ncbi:MAG: TolC family protein, partial [Myxococcota bacterium]
AALGAQFGIGGGNTGIFWSGNAGINAQWQIDIWGQSYLAYRAAELQRDASTGDRDGVSLALANQVAAAYFDVVLAKNSIALVQEQIDANRRLLELIELRFERGDSTGLDVLQQKQQTHAREAELPPLRSQLRAAELRLTLLVGEAPNAGEAQTASALPPLPLAPALGSPQDLVDHRPDLRAALRRAEAASKQASSALRVHLPTLSANGSYQVNYFRLDEGNTVRDWRGGLNLSLPLFSGFGDSAQVSEARASESNAVNALSQSFLTAVQEVENAAVNERELSEQVQLLQEASTAADAALEESEARYVNGLTNYLAVLTALNAAQGAKRSLLQAKRSALAARLQLHQALGGPWTQTLTVANAGGEP